MSNSLQLAYGVRGPRKSAAILIDKLEIRVPADTPFHPVFARLYPELRSDPKKDPFHGSKHYLASGDLRQFGYNSILHLGCRHGERADHKVELVDTGQMPFSRMVCEIERVFETDALKRKVMRVDLAADVKGIRVSWFQERVKANYKQYLADIGATQFVEMGRGGVQTLYFGKRPNLFRIYDKVAEYESQYKTLMRRSGPGASIPTFEEQYGMSIDALLKRVERQIGGGKIPPQMATVSDLRSAPDYRPFDQLRIVTGSKAEPHPDAYSFTEWCAGLHLKHLAETQGMQATLRFIRQRSKRNTRWVLQKFCEFLPDEHPTETVNSDFLNGTYRVTALRQLSV